MNNIINDVIIITTLSTYNPKSTLREYTAENNKKYSGIQTNEAPTKYFLDCIKDGGKNLRKIIYIATEEVRKPIEGKEQSWLELFHSEREQDYGCEIAAEIVEYNTTITAEAAAQNLFEQLKNIIDGQQYAFYVDCTGGYRDISYLTISIIRYLEYIGAKCENIAYSNISSSKIIRLEHIYDIYHLISGVSEFMSSGNAMQLQELANKRSMDKNVNDLIHSLVEFSNVINLCDALRIDETLNNVALSVEKFEKSSNDDFYSAMLRVLLPIIKEKMYLNKELVKDKKIDYLLLIKWCVEHRLVQQAVTFYVEKMPIYYVNKGIVQLPAVEDKTTPEIFYENFCESYVRPALRKVNHFKNELKSFVAVHDSMDDVKLGELFERKYASFGVVKKYIDKIKNTNTSLQIGNNKQINGNTIKARLNNFSNDNNVLFILCGYPEESYEDMMMSGKEYTYQRKLASLEGWIQHKVTNVSESKQDLMAVICGYYIAIKKIRNQMNHANEQEEKVGEEAMDKFFENNNLPGEEHFNIRRDFDNIVKILKQSIAFNMKLAGVKIRLPEELKYVDDEEVAPIKTVETEPLEEKIVINTKKYSKIIFIADIKMKKAQDCVENLFDYDVEMEIYNGQVVKDLEYNPQKSKIIDAIIADVNAQYNDSDYLFLIEDNVLQLCKGKLKSNWNPQLAYESIIKNETSGWAVNN